MEVAAVVNEVARKSVGAGSASAAYNSELAVATFTFETIGVAQVPKDR